MRIKFSKQRVETHLGKFILAIDVTLYDGATWWVGSLLREQDKPESNWEWLPNSMAGKQIKNISLDGMSLSTAKSTIRRILSID